MLKSMKIKTAFILLIALSSSMLSNVSIAGEIDTKKSRMVTDVRKGQTAPYTGILLTTLLAAEVKENCGKDVIDQKIKIEVDGAVKLANSACEEKIQIESGKRTAAEEKYTRIIAAKDKEIEDLRDIIAPPPWYKSPYLWFTVGFVAGTGLTLFTAKNL
jgi:hypothetical protein